MDEVKAGNSPYHFIEIMGCPGGCINGGGQPRSSDPDVREKRLRGIYDEDESKVLRKSHENPAIQTIYKEFLGEPNGKKSHELLHTKYIGRGLFNELVMIHIGEPETCKADAREGISLLHNPPGVTQSSTRENTVDS